MRAPPGVLGEIVDRTRNDLAVREGRVPIATLAARAESATHDFAATLARPGLNLIAEFKPRSPSRGPIRPDASVEDVARLYAPYAAAMSVLCDRPWFGGGFDVLARARAATDLPLLCKDFVVGRYQVYEARVAGADGILLMASVLDDDELSELLALVRSLSMEALVEVHDRQELDRVLRLGPRIVGVNSRDLRSLEIDLGRMCDLLDDVPDGVVRVAESGLSRPEDIERIRGRANAALIGSAFMAAADPVAKIEELGWRRS